MTDTTSNGSGGSLNIGDILGSSFRVLHAALPRFLILSLVPVLPILFGLFAAGTAVSVTSDAFEGGTGAFFTMGIVSVLLVFILYLLMQGAMTYGAFCQLRGRSFTIGEALSRGLVRVLPLLGVAIVSGLAIGLGTMAFLIPGLILICMLYVVMPVCVVEGRGVFDSMARSSELTRGYRWPILGLFLIVLIGSGIASELLVRLVTSITGEMGGQLADVAVQIYTIAFGSVLGALVYYRLRVLKDGVDIERIADVFD